MYERATFAFRSLRDREEGQGLAEYALILSLVSIAVIGALIAIAGGIGNALDAVTDALPGGNGGEGEGNGE